ncbi:MAG: acetyl-CoA carboxylase biotin carboxyl carrier protein [Candidatus Margulisiibacteriota bacterium]|nr:MAG: acetyl-CoA carboxylase, biotin carboxyl carrier protein [Candidatus Margulisbacteria bacterium GWD2_39_127]OGI01670.1 MAG: acetyl-CoA carboxylase, biotin carboxyl carrier protein [Candidatus Margulisbacteria bacterium GWF2_38_17]OGI05855.1 MAG: acetyl-CoA carboxylase, biotin carboxyl carrier protein [Candidatus Margulisbacteria bacterium GWE2_39_32]PZM81855.1 MAG: acetyl-CoA carboxylase biotin carboxyl carrier protein [Candidatus Margulisiibacteriota bacterium]HAR63113.1 acetyl-CoA carb
MDLKEIKNLISIVEKANISSFAIEEDNIKIEIKKETLAAAGHLPQSYTIPMVNYNSATPNATQYQPTSPIENKPQSEVAPDLTLAYIKSPMVGTYYSSPSPEAPMFVKVGERIEKGATICIIEAMKLFNEIESEHSGTVEKILVKNGEPVEYGQPLFAIRLA